MPAVGAAFLTPIFFVSIGLGAQPSALTHAPLFTGLLIVVAILTKIVGCGFGALAGGTTRKEALRIGTGMIGRGEHYALEVTGDSMINAGILDGDTVIIQEADSANTGEIVVALVDDNEATLKRLRRRGDSIALEAANPAYETRLYGADRVKVQGKLVGLIRRY